MPRPSSPTLSYPGTRWLLGEREHALVGLGEAVAGLLVAAAVKITAKYGGRRGRCRARHRPIVAGRGPPIVLDSPGRYLG